MKRTHRSWLTVAALAAVLAGGPLAFVAEGQSPDRPRRAGPPASGERGGAGRVGTEAWLNRLSEQLKLTAEQKKKVEAVQQEQRDQMAKLREDTSLTPEQRREKARALREAMDKKMKEILTSEQYTQWQELRRQRPGGPGGNRGEAGGPGPRPNRGNRPATP